MDIYTIRRDKDPEELAAIQCGVNEVNVEVLTVFFLLIQVKFWSQHISFILVGIIIVTSIRGLLITLTKVRTRTLKWFYTEKFIIRSLPLDGTSTV